MPYFATLPILQPAPIVRRCEKCQRAAVAFVPAGISVRVKHGSEVHENLISIRELLAFLALRGFQIVGQSALAQRNME
jgi:hypothetical protein